MANTSAVRVFLAERENLFSKSTKAERKQSTLHILTYLHRSDRKVPKVTL